MERHDIALAEDGVEWDAASSHVGRALVLTDLDSHSQTRRELGNAPGYCPVANKSNLRSGKVTGRWQRSHQGTCRSLPCARSRHVAGFEEFSSQRENECKDMFRDGRFAPVAHVRYTETEPVASIDVDD